MNREGRGSLADIDVGSSLLLLGEFQSVAEDLDSLLLMTGSTCLGKLTVEAEHLPAPERTQQTTTVHKATGCGWPLTGKSCGLTRDGAADSLCLDHTVVKISWRRPFSEVKLASHWLDVI